MGIGDKTISKWFKLEINSKKELNLYNIIGKEHLKDLKLPPKATQEYELLFNSLTISDINKIKKLRLDSILKKSLRGDKLHFLHEINLISKEEKYIQFEESTYFNFRNNIIFLSLGGVSLIGFICCFLISNFLLYGLLSKLISSLLMIVILIITVKINLKIGKSLLIFLNNYESNQNRRN